MITCVQWQRLALGQGPGTGERGNQKWGMEFLKGSAMLPLERVIVQGERREEREKKHEIIGKS